MSVREYRDAVREYERIMDVLVQMNQDLDFNIMALKQDIMEAENELEDDRKKAQKLGQSLKAPFMTRIDNDVVFRLSNNQPVQIIPFTEE